VRLDSLTNTDNRKELARRIIGLFLLAIVLTVTLSSQIRYQILPFLRSYKSIPYLLSKDDLSLLKEFAYPVYRLIGGINTYPEDTNFYFAPCFADSGNTQIWWWYLHIVTRYFCFPRKILCMDSVLYSDNKDVFISKYIGDAKKYSDLEWIKARKISYVILFRDNAVSILPIDTEINL